MIKARHPNPPPYISTTERPLAQDNVNMDQAESSLSLYWNIIKLRVLTLGLDWNFALRIYPYALVDMVGVKQVGILCMLLHMPRL